MNASSWLCCILSQYALKKDRNSEWKKGENKIKKEGGKEEKEKKGMERSEGREKRGNG